MFKEYPWYNLFNSSDWHCDSNIFLKFDFFKDYLDKTIKLQIDANHFDQCKTQGFVYLSKDTIVHPNTVIYGPAWIGQGCELGPNCFIRPYTILESNVRIGFGVEVKESIIGDGTTISHLSYIGNSIIGRRVMLGAGFCAAVERIDCKPIKLKCFSGCVSTNLTKLGSIIGDRTRIGVYTKVMPGVVIGSDCYIGPDLTLNKCVRNGCNISNSRLNMQS